MDRARKALQIYTRFAAIALPFVIVLALGEISSNSIHTIEVVDQTQELEDDRQQIQDLELQITQLRATMTIMAHGYVDDSNLDNQGTDQDGYRREAWQQ
jgi:hypothetical protein